MSRSGSINFHSKEEVKKLLEIYNPILSKAEQDYFQLKETVTTLKSFLNEDDVDSNIPSIGTKKSAEWNPESWADRVFLALGIIGEECLSRDIMKIVLENEPHIHKTTIGKSLSSALYTLDKAGKIIRKKNNSNRKLISLPEWNKKNNQQN